METDCRGAATFRRLLGGRLARRGAHTCRLGFTLPGCGVGAVHSADAPVRCSLAIDLGSASLDHARRGSSPNVGRLGGQPGGPGKTWRSLEGTVAFPQPWAADCGGRFTLCRRREAHGCHGTCRALFSCRRGRRSSGIRYRREFDRDCLAAAERHALLAVDHRIARAVELAPLADRPVS